MLLEILLYLVKHTRADVADAVCKLSKMLNFTTLAAMKEMHCIIKYVLDRKQFGLKFKPDEDEIGKNTFSIFIFCKSNFAGNKETRISIST